MTIHNLPYLGPDVKDVLESYNLPLANTDLPDWARVVPMPLGLWASDAIVTVSPTYAREIMHEEFGCGLQDFFRNRTDTLHGILNGLDTVSFDPKTDSTLSANFTVDELSLRPQNKAALQEKVGLPVIPNVPLLGMVTRMDQAKGIDIALRGLKMLGKQSWQLVILGAGDPKLEDMAKKLQEAMPDRVRVESRYDAKLARQIYAGSDIFLMPSRYEPCGLSQMIAMRYGSVPLVRAVGGLHDTVTDSETGFVFVDKKIKSFNDTLRRALNLYPYHSRWANLQKAGMTLDFSWPNSAMKYVELYRKLIAEVPTSAAQRHVEKRIMYENKGNHTRRWRRLKVKRPHCKTDQTSRPVCGKISHHRLCVIQLREFGDFRSDDPGAISSPIVDRAYWFRRSMGFEP